MAVIAIPGIEKSELEEKLQQYTGAKVIVKVSGQSLERNGSCHFEMVCSSLVIMQDLLQQVNSGVIVVHGAGKQLDKAIEAAGLPNKKVNGLRYTDDAIYEIVEKEACRLKRDFVETLKLYGANALAMPKGLVTALSLGPEYGGRAGKPIAIEKALLASADYNGGRTLPVVSILGVDPDGKASYNLNADDVAAVLTAQIKPKMLMSVTPSGGILADLGDKSSVIPHLSVEDAAKLSTDGMGVKVKAAEQALKASPGTKVVITSPAEMVYSLFGKYGTTLTHK